jgi:hypothetical protein
VCGRVASMNMHLEPTALSRPQASHHGELGWQDTGISIGHFLTPGLSTLPTHYWDGRRQAAQFVIRVAREEADGGFEGGWRWGCRLVVR